MYRGTKIGALIEIETEYTLEAKSYLVEEQIILIEIAERPARCQ